MGCGCSGTGHLNVKIKKLDENAVIPQYAKFGDAGMDMVCTKVNYTPDYIEYETGISMEIPDGYVGLLFPRSSNSKMDLLLCNSIGVVDSKYRGPINFRYKRVYIDSFSNQSFNTYGKVYNVGDRIGQIIILPYPQINFIETDELTETDRGKNGFGHTGK